MNRDEQIQLFEQPTNGDTAILTCNHRVPVPAGHPRRRDGWHAGLHCPTCGGIREVVSTIYPKKEEQ